MAGLAPQVRVKAQRIVYLSVVGMARAIAVNRRGVNGSRVGAWWGLEVVGGLS
jgi:hypothetical protein